MEKEIIICECNSTNHQYIFLYSEYEDRNGKVDKEVYIHTHLNSYPFWSRIKIGIRYIFGYKSNYGDFDEFIINPDDVYKFEKVVEFLKKCKE
jgi:hypothetical protein